MTWNVSLNPPEWVCKRRALLDIWRSAQAELESRGRWNQQAAQALTCYLDKLSEVRKWSPARLQCRHSERDRLVLANLAGWAEQLGLGVSALGQLELPEVQP